MAAVARATAMRAAVARPLARWLPGPGPQGMRRGGLRSFRGAPALRAGREEEVSDAAAGTGKPATPFGRFSRFARVSTEDAALNEMLARRRDSRDGLLSASGPGGGGTAAAAAAADLEEEEDDEDDYVDMFNPETGEWNGPRLGEPTRYGDWSHKGRATDFE